MTGNAGVVWFVSDVHLRDGDQPYLTQFLQFLSRAGQEADELWILGDLFEFWIGDKQGRGSFYAPLFESLQKITTSGRKVYVVHGNRDFLIGKRFEKVGCQLRPDENLVSFGPWTVHLSHGDQFCLEDLSYQRARVVMRSRPARFLASLMPGALGDRLARSYRGISERKKAKKKIETGNRFHTVRHGIDVECARSDPDIVICGHIHYQADQNLEFAGRSRRVITTGAWEEGPNFVRWDGRDFRLEAFSNSSGSLA